MDSRESIEVSVVERKMRPLTASSSQQRLGVSGQNNNNTFLSKTQSDKQSEELGTLAQLNENEGEADPVESEYIRSSVFNSEHRQGVATGASNGANGGVGGSGGENVENGGLFRGQHRGGTRGGITQFHTAVNHHRHDFLDFQSNSEEFVRVARIRASTKTSHPYKKDQKTGMTPTNQQRNSISNQQHQQLVNNMQPENAYVNTTAIKNSGDCTQVDKSGSEEQTRAASFVNENQTQQNAPTPQIQDESRFKYQKKMETEENNSQVAQHGIQNNLQSPRQNAQSNQEQSLKKSVSTRYHQKRPVNGRGFVNISFENWKRRRSQKVASVGVSDRSQKNPNRRSSHLISQTNQAPLQASSNTNQSRPVVTFQDDLSHQQKQQQFHTIQQQSQPILKKDVNNRRNREGLDRISKVTTPRDFEQHNRHNGPALLPSERENQMRKERGKKHQIAPKQSIIKSDSQKNLLRPKSARIQISKSQSHIGSIQSHPSVESNIKRAQLYGKQKINSGRLSERQMSRPESARVQESHLQIMSHNLADYKSSLLPNKKLIQKNVGKSRQYLNNNVNGAKTSQSWQSSVVTSSLASSRRVSKRQKMDEFVQKISNLDENISLSKSRIKILNGMILRKQEEISKLYLQIVQNVPQTQQENQRILQRGGTETGIIARLEQDTVSCRLQIDQEQALIGKFVAERAELIEQNGVESMQKDNEIREKRLRKEEAMLLQQKQAEQMVKQKDLKLKRIFDARQIKRDQIEYNKQRKLFNELSGIKESKSAKGSKALLKAQNRKSNSVVNQTKLRNSTGFTNQQQKHMSLNSGHQLLVGPQNLTQYDSLILPIPYRIQNSQSNPHLLEDALENHHSSSIFDKQIKEEGKEKRKISQRDHRKGKSKLNIDIVAAKLAKNDLTSVLSNSCRSPKDTFLIGHQLLQRPTSNLKIEQASSLKNRCQILTNRSQSRMSQSEQRSQTSLKEAVKILIKGGAINNKDWFAKKEQIATKSQKVVTKQEINQVKQVAKGVLKVKKSYPKMLQRAHKSLSHLIDKNMYINQQKKGTSINIAASHASKNDKELDKIVQEQFKIALDYQRRQKQKQSANYLHRFAAQIKKKEQQSQQQSEMSHILTGQIPREQQESALTEPQSGKNSLFAQTPAFASSQLLTQAQNTQTNVSQIEESSALPQQRSKLLPTSIELIQEHQASSEIDCLEDKQPSKLTVVHGHHSSQPASAIVIPQSIIMQQIKKPSGGGGQKLRRKKPTVSMLPKSYRLTSRYLQQQQQKESFSQAQSHQQFQTNSQYHFDSTTHDNQSGQQVGVGVEVGVGVQQQKQSEDKRSKSDQKLGDKNFNELQLVGVGTSSTSTTAVAANSHDLAMFGVPNPRILHQRIQTSQQPTTSNTTTAGASAPYNFPEQINLNPHGLIHFQSANNPFEEEESKQAQTQANIDVGDSQEQHTTNQLYFINSQRTNAGQNGLNSQQPPAPQQISYFSSGGAGTFFPHEHLQRLPEEIIDECNENEDELGGMINNGGGNNHNNFFSSGNGNNEQDQQNNEARDQTNRGFGGLEAQEANVGILPHMQSENGGNNDNFSTNGPSERKHDRQFDASREMIRVNDQVQDE